jgi:hypothetical protein
MPALIGYMLAIVVTLGGYFAGLHWLISPPDPWQANARMQTTGSAHPAAKKRTPVKPVEAAASIEPAAPKEPDVKIAAVETPAPVAVTASEPASPVEAMVAPRPLPQPASPPRAEEKPSARAEAARPEPRRESKPKPLHRKLAERSQGRKLQLMVLRTYERADGTRFSRLLSLHEARSAMAFQPEW